ncbi:hypothetical protein H0H93_004468, partial [Arthromyces matolae]
SKNEENANANANAATAPDALPTTTKEVIAVKGGAGGVAAPIIGGTSAEKNEVREKEAPLDPVIEKKEEEDGTSSDTVATTQTTEAQQEAKKNEPAAGPIGEAEHEAQKAAEELFPGEARR